MQDSLKSPRFIPVGLLVILGWLFSCRPSEMPVEQPALSPTSIISLLGDTLHTPERSAARQAVLDSNLSVAQTHFEAYPDSEACIIWYGRRLAYLARYRESIEVYTAGLEKMPDSYRLLRHRGHRYITLRKFDAAIQDLTRAAQLVPTQPVEIEPDGIPNRLNIPLSNTQFNIWYHLGLAYYLKGEYELADAAYKRCMEVSVNDDLKCATLDWWYMTLQRLKKGEEAQALLDSIHSDMEIIENDSYHRRLLMYKGELTPEALLQPNLETSDLDLAIATQGYGVGNWYRSYMKDTAKSTQIFQQVLSGKSWAAFGYIAAEVDINHMNLTNSPSH